MQDPSLLDECDIDEKTKSTLLENIQLKLSQQAVKIRADIEVACYTNEGIDSVKDALKAGMAVGTEEVPIKINLIAPPLYVVTTSTPERQVRNLVRPYDVEFWLTIVSNAFRMD